MSNEHTKMPACIPQEMPLAEKYELLAANFRDWQNVTRSKIEALEKRVSALEQKKPETEMCHHGIPGRCSECRGNGGSHP